MRCPVGGMSEGSRAFPLIFIDLFLSSSLHPLVQLGWICSLQQGGESESERETPQTKRDIIQVSESKGRDQLPGAGRDSTTSDLVARRYTQYLRKLEEIKQEEWRRGKVRRRGDERKLEKRSAQKEEAGKESQVP